MRKDMLQGQVCLVTGGSRTLGAALARRLAAAGAMVVVNFHQSRSAAELLCEEIQRAGGRAEVAGADVTDPEEAVRLVDATWSTWGAIDILVNTVGHYDDSPFLALPLATFDRIIDGNLRTTFHMSQLVGRRMKQRGAGIIVNIGATDMFHRSHSVYGLAKEGVAHLTEAFALELAPEVRVHAVAPDLIAENEDMSAEFAARAVEGTPMRRLVTRDEIAEVVCMLCTPAFTMMTGRTIVLDGGRSIPRISFDTQ